MPFSPRSKIDKTKKFVMKHRVLLACSATALVTYAVTRQDVTHLKTLLEQASERIEMDELDFAEVSRRYIAHVEFVIEKDLMEEYQKFYKTLEI